MNTEAHLAVGWLLAHSGGAETRRFRAIVTFASLAPDLDVISYVGGTHAYASLHHALGHNIFFSIALSAVMIAVSRANGIHRVMKILLFTQLAFYAHYFGDYFFTRFPLEFFWPVSTKGYIYSYRIGLDHPINLVFGYGSFLLMIGMAMIFKRTPIELVWPELDRRVVNLFANKKLTCHICARGANESCTICGRPCCIAHARLTSKCQVRCADCRHLSDRVAVEIDSNPSAVESVSTKENNAS